jgi:hypothetical protein
MSLYDLLAPGDDISYRKPPLDRPLFGRVIRRDGGRIFLHRYREQVMSNREGLHAIFFLLSELVQTDEEDNVDQSHIVAIIFILTVAKLSSFNYSVEGISNVYYIREETFQSFAVSGLPLILWTSIISIQRAIYKMVNNTRMGQVLKANQTLFLHPLGWEYVKQQLTAGIVNRYIDTDGRRTERVIQPGLLKESVARISRIQSIIISTQEGMMLVKNLFGRYSGIGTRCKYPKKGAPAIPVLVGTNINIIELLKLKYSSDHWELKVSCSYRAEVAGVNTTW